MKDVFPYSYRAFGLGIRSAFPLPELVEDAGPAEVLVHKGAISQFAPEAVDPARGPYTTADRALLTLEGVGSFLIRDGREIVAEPAPGVADETLRMAVVGLALGMLLHQRGLLLLHASAVEMAGGVVAFLGDKGRGKSTLAAALQAQGHRLVTDDVLALTVCPGQVPLAHPSFPQIRLWPESVAAALKEERPDLPLVHSALDKRRWRVDDAFSDEPLPLKHLFVLEVGEALSVERLPRVQALDLLIRNAYLLPFIRPTGTEGRLFQQCAELARNVPAARLVRVTSLSDLDRLIRIVQTHAGDAA